MVATWLSGHARAAFLLLAFAGCGEAFTGGGTEAGEAGASGSEEGGSSGDARTGGSGKGGSSGAGAMSGRGGSSGAGGRAGAVGTGGAAGASAQGGDAGSAASTSGSGTAGAGSAGDGGSGNDAGSGGTAGTGGVSGIGGLAGTGGVVIGPDIPTQGLVLWLRADEGVTITDDHHVLSWADQSGRENHVEQAESEQRPTLATRENGLVRVEFDGVDDFMSFSAGLADFSAGLSAFFVTNARSLDYCWALLELSNGSEVDDVFVGHYAMSPHYEVLDSWLTSGAYPYPDDLVFSVVHTADRQLETRTNGSVAGSAEMALPAVVERTQNFLGLSQYEACGVLEGSLSEVLLYDRAVSREELLAIEEYLAKRWGCCQN